MQARRDAHRRKPLLPVNHAVDHHPLHRNGLREGQHHTAVVAACEASGGERGSDDDRDVSQLLHGATPVGDTCVRYRPGVKERRTCGPGSTKGPLTLAGDREWSSSHGPSAPQAAFVIRGPPALP